MSINVREIFEPTPPINVRLIMQEAESERFFKELYSGDNVYYDGDRDCFVRETVLNFDSDVLVKGAEK